MPDTGFLLRVSRPRFWIYVFGPYLIGLAAAAFSREDLMQWPVFLFAAYFLFPANLIIYGINDIFDYETDRRNSKKQDYEQLVTPGEHKELLYLILITNLPFVVIALYFAPGASIALLAFFFFSVLYSAPPIRAKGVPFLDSAFNILYIFPGVFAYKMVSGQYPPASIFAAAAAWTAAMHAYSAIPDIEADRAAKLPTIATTLGLFATHIFCLVMYILAAALSFPYLGWIAVASGAVYAAMVLISLRFSGKGNTFTVYRFFPYVNSACGFALFWYIGFPKLY